MFASEAFGGLIPGAQGAVLRVLLRTAVPLTGREVHRLATGHSLTAVQAALKVLVATGVIESFAAGRALMYTANQDHVALEALRILSDPRELLRTVVVQAVADDAEVVSVVLFGSAARGEADRDSDVDLAVLTRTARQWAGRVTLREAVERRFGGGCDTVVFGADEFEELARTGAEPVVLDIVRDRFLLYGLPISRAAVRAEREARNGADV